MLNPVDDIKARISIEDLVAQYVQLKKAGKNFKGLCPFHNEKTPSFVVSPEKQICHCFGCNKGGDIFGFIQELESVSFPEALKILGDKAGVEVSGSNVFEKKSKGEKDIYFKAHELACEFFEKKLHDTPEGKKVLEYLYKRGIKDESIKEFRIGFAPDSYDALHSYLLKQGVSKIVLLKSGLVSEKKLASDEIYDKYRSRLMFPIFDYFGRVCGFGGRSLSKDQMPKYINSQENIIYNKSKVLYGLSHAKQFVKEKDCAVLVEGYFDVILPYQEGVKNVVATSGTALSDDQAKLVKRLTSNIVTCFDNDSAGFEATKRSYFVFQKYDANVRTVDKMEGKDPADYVLENPDGFTKIVEGSKDFPAVFVDELIKNCDVNSSVGRQKFLKEVLPLYVGMSPVDGDFFVRMLAKKLGINERFLYDEISNLKLGFDHPARLEEENEKKGVKLSVEQMTIALLLENPFLFDFAKNFLNLDDFCSELKSIYNELTNQYNCAQGDVNAWDFDKGVFVDFKDKIGFMRLYAEEFYGEFLEEVLKNEMVKLVDRMKEERKIRKLKEIQEKIKEAEKDGKKEDLKLLLQEQMSEISKK